MSITETTTQINHRTVATMKRSKLEDVAVLFAEKSVQDESQIAQLTAENDRLHRVVEQAIELAKIERVKRRSVGTSHYYEEGLDAEYPDLYAHLKREGE